MPKLSDTQTIILVAAAQRASGSLYPLPVTITAPAATVTRSLAALAKRGYAAERETGDPDAIARRDGDLRYGLFITAAGEQAIGIKGGKEQPAPSPAPPVAAPATKAATVLALLGRAGGATLPELIAATGWLPHTTRAALTGLRKKGHAIVRDKRDGATCYHLAQVG